jgi:hypothetical protein
LLHSPRCRADYAFFHPIVYSVYYFHHLSLIQVGTIYALKLLQHEKGKLCESRGRKVTDLTGKCPTMAGLPDNANRLNHIPT